MKIIDTTQYILNDINNCYDIIHFPIGKYNNNVIANFKWWYPIHNFLFSPIFSGFNIFVFM